MSTNKPMSPDKTHGMQGKDASAKPLYGKDAAPAKGHSQDADRHAKTEHKLSQK